MSAPVRVADNLVQMVSTVVTFSTSAKCFHLFLEFPLTDTCPVAYDDVQLEAEAYVLLAQMFLSLIVSVRIKKCFFVDFGLPDYCPGLVGRELFCFETIS